MKIIVPFAAGGSTDRRRASSPQKLTRRDRARPSWSRTSAGAGGNLGAAVVAKAKPDGYTLLAAAGSFAINPSLYQSLPFDTVKDFDPVILVCSVTGILVVNPRCR